ncbi:Charged multivesicular body protein 4b [Orchesella cincta]|uniref:Charged multivesicular body protein 4b n=1 Tax=Orchesella cincta TaxID=48709 RepID=A0A1D2MIW5_ORCCI|nr:Charged multivesicular body protein 4b [Orchesella cincta]
MKKSKFWQRLFGSKQPNHITGTKDGKSNRAALERLREMEEMLQKKQTHIENCIQVQIETAKKHGTKNKRAALMALTRKRRLEAELKRIDGTLTTIELQREALEAAKNNLQVLGAMQDAANVLKEAQKHVTVDQVLDIMDDINEQQETANEIADAIANPLKREATFDDSELETELEQLEQEELDKALLQVDVYDTGSKTNDDQNKDSALPVVTNEVERTKLIAGGHDAKKDADPDEKELQELAQWST